MADGSGRRGATRYTMALEGCAERISPTPAGIFRVAATNISLTGLMVHGHSDLGVFVSGGDVVRLSFSSPDTGVAVVVKGVVKWKRRSALNILGQWSLGVKFQDTSDSEIRKLHDRVQKAWSAPSDN